MKSNKAIIFKTLINTIIIVAIIVIDAYILRG